MTRREHLLVVLMEEAAEVQKLVCKALRFGEHDHEPGTDESQTNLVRIEEELGDLLGTADMLGLTPLHARRITKADRVERYLEYARERGLVSG